MIIKMLQGKFILNCATNLHYFVVIIFRCPCPTISEPVNMYRFCQLLKHKLPLNNLKQPVGNNVRQYFKPSQGKDAFFDVEGVVTKDVLLFRYDDSGKVFWINLIAMGMFPIWTYMGYTAYSLK